MNVQTRDFRFCSHRNWKWNNGKKAHLKFPLLVAYFMWLQIASNIPLVVVTRRQSNTCKTMFDDCYLSSQKTRARALQKKKTKFILIDVQSLKSWTRQKERKIVARHENEFHLQFGPLNASDTASRVSPCQFGAVNQFGLCQMIRSFLFDVFLHLFQSGFVRRWILSERMKKKSREDKTKSITFNDCQFGILISTLALLTVWSM